MAIMDYKDLYTPQGRTKFLCYIDELKGHEDIEPIFTVRNEKKGLISLKKLYMKYCVDDPSEATFAEEVFGDLGYWMQVRESPRFLPFLRAWREEAEVMRKRNAFLAVAREIKSEGRSAFTAARFLIEEPWKNRAQKKAAKKTTQEAFTKADLEEDVARLREAGLVN